MNMFDYYRPSNKYSKNHLQCTILLGLTPLVLLGLLLVVDPEGPSPLPAFFFGLLLGCLLILWGAYELRNPSEKLSGWGRRRAETIDRWFPALLFVIQNLFVIVCFVLVWVSLGRIGIRVPWWIHANLYALIAFIPIWRFVHEGYRVHDNTRWRGRCEIVRNITAILTTLLIASALSLGLLPAGSLSSQKISPGIVAIWVPAILIILGYLILFVERAARRFGTEPEKKGDPEEP